MGLVPDWSTGRETHLQALQCQSHRKYIALILGKILGLQHLFPHSRIRMNRVRKLLSRRPSDLNALFKHFTAGFEFPNHHFIFQILN